MAQSGCSGKTDYINGSSDEEKLEQEKLEKEELEEERLEQAKLEKARLEKAKLAKSGEVNVVQAYRDRIVAIYSQNCALWTP